MHNGIDVSRYQLLIDWKKVSKTQKFAFMKATEGISYKDATYPYNYTNSKLNGIYTGAYHFFRPRYDAVSQAKNFLAYSKLQKGDLPPVCDFEVSDGMSLGQINYRLKVWFDYVQNALGIRPILYSNASTLNTYLPGSPKWVEGILLWIANYTTEPQPYMPRGWKTWAFWQYSATGKVAGIKTNVDLDYCSLEQIEDILI